MKKIFAILLSTMMALPATASERTDKIATVVRLSSELATLNSKLEQDKSNRNSAIIQTVISAALATYLIKSGVHRINNPTGGDIGSGMDQGLGIIVAAVGGGAGIYGAAQSFRVFINVRDIARIQRDIQAKQEQLDIAKKVLETIE